MKQIGSFRILALVSSSAVHLLFQVNAWAQQITVPSSAPGASAAPNSSIAREQSPAVDAGAPSAPDASAPQAPRSEKPAGSAAAVPTNGETIDSAAERFNVAPLGDSATVELAPIPRDALQKKHKKQKGKARRDAPRFDDGKAEPGTDDSWGDPWGDSQDELRAAGLSFRFLLQSHYQYTHVRTSKNSDEAYRAPEEQLAHNNDGWDVNRLFFRIAAQPSRYLSLKMITDFAEFKHGNGKQAIKQAYVTLTPLPKHIHVLTGILKVPYSITELDPIAQYEFASLGLANDLVKNLDFAGRDVGAELLVTPFSKPRYLQMIFGVFQGHSKDENASPIGSIGARVESHPVKTLRIGVDWVEQPKSATYNEYFDTSDKALMPNPDNPTVPISKKWLKGQAFSGDITFQSAGLLLRTEAMYGTRVDYYTRYGAGNFAAVWASASYKFPVGALKFQPGVRVEWLDADTQHSVGTRRQLTLGLGTYFSPKIRTLIDVTRSDIQDNSPVIQQPVPLPAIPYNALSNTRVTAQLQVVL